MTPKRRGTQSRYKGHNYLVQLYDINMDKETIYICIRKHNTYKYNLQT